MVRTIFLLILVITGTSAFSQPEKDALLVKDIEKVKARIEVMVYLDRLITTDYLAKTHIESGSYDFQEYYRDSILGNNPEPTVNINEYLGYRENYTPPAWKYFTAAVWQKNAEHLIEIIKNYGYPSSKRIYNTDSPTSSVIIVFDRAPVKYKDIMWPLVKKEYRLGNMSEADLEFCRFFYKSNGSRSPEEFARFQKKMEKLGVKFSGPGQ